MKKQFRTWLISVVTLVVLILMKPDYVFSAEAGKGLVFGEWYCAGPFKDERVGNVMRSIDFVFGPEEDISEKGLPNLERVYQAQKFPWILDTERRWQKHPEWSDGYRNLLPRDGAPSRNETVYLYRVITAKDAVKVDAHFRAEDAYIIWLNGERVFEYKGVERYPSPRSFRLNLGAGENHLVIKNTSRFAAHGFSFGIVGVHPTYEDKSFYYPMSVQNRFYSSDVPYASGEKAVGRAMNPADVLARLREFRFEPTPIPMYSPAVFTIDNELSRLPSSSGAKQYDVALVGLRERIGPILRAGDGANAEQVIAAAAELDAMWSSQFRKLPPVLFVRRPYAGVNAIAPYSTGGSEPSSICLFDPARPEEPVKVVFQEEGIRIYDMNLSYDAKTIFFSARRKGVPGGWHIYEVGVDGDGLKQITKGDRNDISPLLLPDGRVMYISTQADTWVQCQGQRSGQLYSANRDGTGIKHLSANIDSDHTPQIMNDGRVMFTRWDYGIEKNVFARHAIWTMNPDGTRFKLFFGNTIEDPGAFWKARQVPGRPEVICVLGPHHSHQAGMIGLVWNQKGAEAPRGKGFRWITQEVPVYGDKSMPFGYQDPFPVNEKLYLVSYGGDGGNKNRLYLLDNRGNRKCIYEAEGNLGCWYPMLLTAREVPPSIVGQADTPDWVYREPEEANMKPDSLEGTLLIQDVYTGISPHVKRGQAKYIQVVEQVQKSRCMAGGEAWGHTPIISRGTVHVKRVLGTVPIEEDGSAHFTAPALRNIYLNVLDAEGKALMRMGSDMHLMPGERVSCIGCHEIREGITAPPRRDKIPIAATKPAVKPQMPDWDTDGLIDYIKVVQPVWDRYCLKCHSGATPKGGVNLTSDRTRFFCQSYDQLVDRGWVDFQNVFGMDHDDTSPLISGSYVSKLCERIEGDHCKKKIPLEDRMRIYAWIDANIPYYGTYNYIECKGIGARDSWKAGGTWASRNLKEAFEKRCLDCHKRRVFNPAWYTPGWKILSSDLWNDMAIASHGFPERYPLSGLLGPELRVNLTNPSHSLLIQAPLAKDAGGLGMCKLEDGRPVFTDKGDIDYRVMLAAIETGKARLYAKPRIDMSIDHVEQVRKTVLSDTELAKGEALWESVRKVDFSKGIQQLDGIPAGCKNLALGGTASSPDGVPIQGTPPNVSEQAAIDGDRATYWDDADGAKLYRLKVDFKEAVNVSVISIMGWNHYDFSPCDFRILCDGKEIGSVKDAPYDNNLFVFSIPRTKCSSLELAIDKSYGGSPAIRELGIYDTGK